MTALVPLALTPRIARDLSYSHAARTPLEQGMIRTVEALTGRMTLIRRAQGYDRALAQGEDFWREMMRRCGLHLEIMGGSLEDVPQAGPLVMLANHPHGLLDGLVMGYILSGLRGDFRILAQDAFRRPAELSRVMLPYDFAATMPARRGNVAARAFAVDYLRAGGAIGVFPGGRVSTGARLFDRPVDPEWRTGTARMIARSGASVVPVWFEGGNSALFQLAARLNATLSAALLLREFRARVDRPVRLVIGRPIPTSRMQQFAGDAPAMMDFLRRSTYELAPEGHSRGR